MADADDAGSSGSGTGSEASGSGRGRSRGRRGRGSRDSLQLLTKLDKAVSTNDILLDLQRALTYEAVFSTLVEHKMQALKRDYEEHKRAKRKKRKSIGRILLPRKLFGVRRASKDDSQEEELEVETLPSTCPAKTAPSHCDDIEVASGSLSSAQRPSAAPPQTEMTPALEDSLASTLSNSSGRQGITPHARHSHSLLVQAQTHTPAKHSSDEDALTPLPETRHSTTINGGAITPIGSTYCDNTSSLATATVVGGTRILHSSTLADDSLTASLRGSLESLSYSSSRCTVSFGGAEVIAMAQGDADTRERARLAKRLRILEAKSISAQCSPIFPRSVARTIPLPAPQQARIHVNFPSSLAKPQPHVSLEIESLPVPSAHPSQYQMQPEAMVLPQRKRLLPKQLSCTESYSGAGSDFDGAAAAYARYFSRQNTSEDSANVTVSTVLAQSDSQSLHALPSYANTPTASADKLKSRSTGLLVTPEAIVIPIEAAEEEEMEEEKGGYEERQKLGQAGERLPAQKLAEKLQRMTSTSTGSSVAPTGCCTAAKSAASRAKEKHIQSFKPTLPMPASTTAAQSTGSDDEYRRRKRKYKRHHRCSDPALVYPTPNGLQHYVHVMGMAPDAQSIQCPYAEDSPCDLQLDMDLDMDADKIDDLEHIVPGGGHQRHRRKHRHRQKKRHRHKKPKILVQDLDTEVVKVIDPHDLSQRARWTIIATACLLLLMCLMLIGVTLRMAPIIDDMVRQENERSIRENLERTLMMKNLTELNLQRQQQILYQAQQQQHQQQQH